MAWCPACIMERNKHLIVRACDFHSKGGEGGGEAPQLGAWTSSINAVRDPPKGKMGGQIPLQGWSAGNLFFLKRNVLGERLIKSHRKALSVTQAGLFKNNAPHFSEKRKL